MASEKILQLKMDEVAVYVELLKKSKSFIFAQYRGITVDQDTNLRNEMRKYNVKYKVVKNSILSRALKEIGYEGLEPYMKGPTSVAICDEDSIAPSKILSKFQKDIECFEIKAGVVEGKIVNREQVNTIAQLPPKEELIARVLGGLNSPIVGFVNVLNANIRGLVVALNAISKQKQSAAQN